MEVKQSPTVRLGLCANVFPAHNPKQAFTALDLNMRRVAAHLKPEQLAKLNYGLYFSQACAEKFANSPDLLAKYKSLIDELGLKVFSANAFPFGDFHADHVKQQAFLPDWRDSARGNYTILVADLLSKLATSDLGLSISTCPFGYTSDAANELSVSEVRRVVAHLRQIHSQHGKHIRLAFEAEPCACFSDSCSLIKYLSEKFSPDELMYLGICFDLCHSAVTAEHFEEVLDLAAASSVHIAKVQISSALQRSQPLCATSKQDLAHLGDSPFFHQANVDGELYPDLSSVPDGVECEATSWRIHCHVPICSSDYSSGWQGTPWRPAVTAAMASGVRDFEIETYTLRLLNTKFIGFDSVEECIANEISVGISALRLDTVSG